MSGDGVAGGAFMTGFTVVPYGNVVYARPDYVENPLLPSTLSDGRLAKPYPVLAAEGNPNTRAGQSRPRSQRRAEQHVLLSAGQLQPRLRLQRRRQVRAVGPLCGVAASFASSFSARRPGRRRGPCRAFLSATRSPAR